MNQELEIWVPFCRWKIVQKIGETNQQGIGNYTMHYCLKRLPHPLRKSSFDLKVKLKMLALFLLLKDNSTEHVCLKPVLNR